MSSDALALVLVGLAYLSGSIPFGVLIARSRGIDIQREGSGNIGASNVARSLGKKLGAVVLLLDALKGAGPVLLTGWLLPLPTWPLGAVALAAVVGHCFPVWLRFRGGKGVATALGVFVVLEPLAALGSVVVFAAVYAALRIASVGSLVASMAFVPIAWWLGSPRSVVMLALVIVLLIVVQHRDNLKRLRRGREHRL